jgi:tRNA modification GTPase
MSPKLKFDTTVVAPASGSGGAISVIRLSGKKAFSYTDLIFKSNVKREAINEAQSKGFRIVYGDIVDGDAIIDDVLVSFFKAPNSYTGEDLVEISCHASAYIQNTILQLLLSKGASPARPGEFTQRAFINGKMDLSQAEAVADVIASETEASHRLALNQMRGGYSAEINKLREKMLHFASMIELELDFGEEDVEFANRDELRNMVVEIKEYTDSLADSFRYGNVIKNGVPVAIVGKPNSGKSTLLNSFLKDDRAIVSEIPGTTRDVIEDTIIIEGILFRFIDTAGLRETADLIENLGIRKTYQKIEQADIVLLMADAIDPPEVINKAYRTISDQIVEKHKALILVVNKKDLLTGSKLVELKNGLTCRDSRCVIVSALDGEGIDVLTSYLTQYVSSTQQDGSNLVVTNLRHYDALKNCSDSLARVLEGMDIQMAEDLLAMDLRQAIHYLGEITGEISTDEILGNIFKNFCIGK